MTHYPGEPVGSPEFWRPFLANPWLDGLSITIFDREGHQSSIGASDEVAARIDEAQFDLGVGPRWDVLKTGRPVLGGSLTQWPFLAASLDELGVGGVSAFPMFVGAAIVGVVDLYSRAALELDSEAELTTARLVRLATGRAVHAALQSAEERDAGSPPAPAMRREVHQATGIILAHLDVTATDALLRLRAHAFVSGRPVLAVARDVVAGDIDFRDFPD